MRQNRKSLSRSIALKFVAIVFISNIIFICVMFFVLRLQLAEKDQNIASARFYEIAKVIEVSGIEKLKSETEKGQFNKLEDLLIVIYDGSHSKVFERMPRRLENFDVKEIHSKLDEMRGRDGVLTIYPEEVFEETIETFTGNIGSYRLTVGVNTDASEDFLHLFFQVAMIVSTISILFSMVLGYYSTKKSLKPIHDLISTVKSVQAGEWKTISKQANSEDELSELINLFNDMIVQIQKLVSSLQNSLDAIAHDLRTPLTHVSNKIENLLKDDVNLTKDSIGDLMEEVQGISSLVNTLLEITEADSKSLLLRKEIFDMEGLIKESVDLYEYISEEKQAEVLVKCDSSILVNGDRNRLKRVLANLLDNALKYSFENPKILVECEKREDQLIVAVEDSGVGIPESDVNKIWQRLYRGDVSRTTQGMGLGLSFVKSIVDAHSWTIHVESGKEGKGARFVITIPISKNIVETPTS